MAIWISLNLLDLSTTVVLLGNSFTEANPAIAWLQGNIAGLMCYKIGLPLLVIPLLVHFRKRHLFRWLNIGIAVVVAWNLMWLYL